MANGDETDASRFTARSLALRVGLLLVLLGLVAWLLTDLVPGSGTRLANARTGWVIAEVVLEVIACAGYAALFHATFSYGEYRIPSLRSAQIAVGELGAFAVVPTGVGGPLLRYWGLTRSGMPLRTLLVRSVSHAVVFNVPYVAAAVALGGTVALSIGPGHAPLAVALAPIGLVIASLALVALALVANKRARPRRRRPGRMRDLARAAAGIVPDGLREVPGRLPHPGALGGAVAYWAGDCAVLIAAFHAAGGSAPVAVVVLAYMLGQLGNILPLPGGIGGVEPLMLGVLEASGHGGSLAAAAIVLYRIVSLGTQGVLGAIAVGTLVPSLRATSQPGRSS